MPYRITWVSPRHGHRGLQNRLLSFATVTALTFKHTALTRFALRVKKIGHVRHHLFRFYSTAFLATLP